MRTLTVIAPGANWTRISKIPFETEAPALRRAKNKAPQGTEPRICTGQSAVRRICATGYLAGTKTCLRVVNATSASPVSSIAHIAQQGVDPAPLDACRAGREVSEFSRTQELTRLMTSVRGNNVSVSAHIPGTTKSLRGWRSATVPSEGVLRCHLAAEERTPALAFLGCREAAQSQIPECASQSGYGV